jgi:hypothetical protein
LLFSGTPLAASAIALLAGISGFAKGSETGTDSVVMPLWGRRERDPTAEHDAGEAGQVCRPSKGGATVSKFLYVGRHATDDPTLATFPFVLALAAAEEGHQVEVALLGEAAYLIKDEIADQVQGVGFPALRELMPKALQQGVQIHV